MDVKQVIEEYKKETGELMTLETAINDELVYTHRYVSWLEWHVVDLKNKISLMEEKHAEELLRAYEYNKKMSDGKR